MTAPETPAGAPPCVHAVIHRGAATKFLYVTEASTARVDAGDFPAIAVPDALWADDGFAEAVLRRYHVGMRGMSDSMFAERLAAGIDTIMESLAAIHAELSERAK